MCGRFDQNDINRLVRDFSWTSEILNRSTAEGSWNVAPTSMRPVMYTQNDDPRLFIDDRHWVTKLSGQTVKCQWPSTPDWKR